MVNINYVKEEITASLMSLYATEYDSIETVIEASRRLERLYDYLDENS